MKKNEIMLGLVKAVAESSDLSKTSIVYICNRAEDLYKEMEARGWTKEEAICSIGTFQLGPIEAEKVLEGWRARREQIVIMDDPISDHIPQKLRLVDRLFFFFRRVRKWMDEQDAKFGGG